MVEVRKMSSKNQQRRRQHARKKTPIWGATVTLPTARPVEQQVPPRVVVRTTQGQESFDEGLADLDLGVLRPARQFRNRKNQRHAPQRHYYETINDFILTESYTEAMAAHLLFRREDVRRIFPQPMWMERLVDGKPSWACPDFLVEHHDGSRTIVEVKRASYRPADSTLIKLYAVERSCRALGLSFELMTGLPTLQQKAFNLFIGYRNERCLRGAGVDELQAVLLSRAAEPTSIGDLWAEGPLHQTKPMVWHLLWRNLLCMDWSNPIDEETVVLAHGQHKAASTNADLQVWRCGPANSPTLDQLWATEVPTS